MTLKRVRVRRERPGAAAWAVALAVTMLAVYLLTLPSGREPESLFASAPVTRRLRLAPVEAWCVSLARCDTPEQARVAGAAYANRGGAGVAARLDGAWHALGAAYDTRQEAERIAARLREAGADAAVLRLYLSESELRMTAPEALLDAVAAGDALLREQAERLGVLARQLDRGEITAEAVHTLCALAASRTRDAARALGGGEGDDALVGSIARRLTALSGLLDALVAAPARPAAGLSGLLRAARIETLLGLVEWQEGLGQK